jgi:E3 ubiquitin-protein ligase HECTD2
VVLQFVTIRQFPPADKSLPPLSKSRWWIPTATKVLALVNAANNLKQPSMLDYTEFYNISLGEWRCQSIDYRCKLALIYYSD